MCDSPRELLKNPDWAINRTFPVFILVLGVTCWTIRLSRFVDVGCQRTSGTCFNHGIEVKSQEVKVLNATSDGQDLRFD